MNNPAEGSELPSSGWGWIFSALWGSRSSNPLGCGTLGLLPGWNKTLGISLRQPGLRELLGKPLVPILARVSFALCSH